MNALATLPVIDGLLAATARVHGLTVVSRNTKDIARTDVPGLNPLSRQHSQAIFRYRVGRALSGTSSRITPSPLLSRKI